MTWRLMLAAVVVALSGCGLLPPSTMAIPPDVQQDCGFPEGTTLMFARERVTLQELGLVFDDPNSLVNPAGTVYVSAEAVPMAGTRPLRAWCIVYDDEPSGMTSGMGAVSDDWTPPQP